MRGGARRAVGRGERTSLRPPFLPPPPPPLLLLRALTKSGNVHVRVTKEEESASHLVSWIFIHLSFLLLSFEMKMEREVCWRKRAFGIRRIECLQFCLC